VDTIFVEGVAATISAIIVFCGSVWLILTMVMGARLAYFVTASITLAFIIIMSVVWSINPLGPVGELPSWQEVSASENAAQLEGPSASSYPDSPWTAPSEDDEEQQELASDLESDATDLLESEIEAGNIQAFTDVTQAVVSEGGTRFLEQDGTTYGAVQLEPAPAPEEGGEEQAEEGPITNLDVPPTPKAEETPAAQLPDKNARVFVLMQLDEGNELGPARMISFGALILFVLHVFGLSLSERRSRARLNGNGGGSGS
jgi:hypothetical protein